ncbi:cupin domain-containing protein, partial [Streptomyces sp. SID7803]|nr:cupin domain-containing protein [Streptomyces sp. SID7803]
ELCSWRLMPGEAAAPTRTPEGTVELLHVTAGTLTLVVADTPPYEMGAGTSATFEAHHPHAYRNEGTEPVELTMAVSVPPVG